MRMFLGFSCILVVSVVSAATRAGIPEPSSIVYGSILLNGQPVGASADVSVTARVNGVTNPVGSYHMNDLPGATGQCTAGRDCYAVKIRLENLADGGNQSNNTALVGQTVKLYVKSGTDPEVFAANYVITGRGTIQNLDLTATSVVQGDIDGDGDVDAADRSLFIAVLLGIDTDPSHIARSDLDISGGVNGRDIQAFVTATIP